MLTEQEFLDNIFVLEPYHNGNGWQKSSNWKCTYRYYVRYQLHREIGPAIYTFNASSVLLSWRLNGHYIKSKEEWFNMLTEEQKIIALFNPENW